MTTGGLEAAAAIWLALGDALGVTLVAAGAPVCAPNSVGFHQTTRNATARPMTTALINKFTRTRVLCN
jgi:hypothetical protein